MFSRFSTVAGERGAADAERDIRGFAFKFYTEEGNWDIVGNNTPVFFFRDPLRFPDLNHAIKRDPRTGMRSADNNWDFWTLLPGGAAPGHDRDVRSRHPKELPPYARVRQPHLLDDQCRERARLGQIPFPHAAGHPESHRRRSRSPVAKDRESHGRDLFNAIEAGDFPRWTLFIQVMTDAQAKTHRHNPFDLTKVWPKAEYPLIEVGVMELNRWPDNYFAEVEQAAFGPSNVVPGISFSPDRMLQARLFSYPDTVLHRLGVNFYQIPINAPKCPYMSYHRDGKMRIDGNLGGTTSFNPNSAGLWDNQPDFAEPPLPIEGEAAHYDHYADDDHWEQPGNLFRLMTPAQQQALFENTARALGDARQHIKERHIANCRRADPAYGEGVARALSLDPNLTAE